MRFESTSHSRSQFKKQAQGDNPAENFSSNCLRDLDEAPFKALSIAERSLPGANQISVLLAAGSPLTGLLAVNAQPKSIRGVLRQTRELNRG
jgi:hypothetical protein